MTRTVVLGFISVACFAQQGAKALFYDPTSGVSLSGNTATGSSHAAQHATPGPKANSGGTMIPVSETRTPEVTGLRYWIELRTAQDQLLRVPASRVFHSGERIRLHIESNIDGNLTILQSQDNGPFAKLYPLRSGTGHIDKLTDETIPSRTGWFRFDNNPGSIRLMMMLQAEAGSGAGAASGPVQMASNANPGAPADVQALEVRMREHMSKQDGSKSLVVEEDAASEEPSSYVVVDARRAPAVEKGVVAVEVKLTHR